MATRGAKNLIVTSRGANAEDKARPFMTEMEKVGCRVKAVGCDVSDAGDLAEALATCKEDMPPIRGVVQGAMVLEVCIDFGNAISSHLLTDCRIQFLSK